MLSTHLPKTPVSCGHRAFFVCAGDPDASTAYASLTELTGIAASSVPARSIGAADAGWAGPQAGKARLIVNVKQQKAGFSELL